MTLPSGVGYHDFRELHRRDLSFWLAPLERIRRREGVQATEWRRAPLGRNVVFFLGDDLVVKIVPPFWSDQAEREAQALTLVAGRLRVRTPQLLGSGEIDGWRYLLLSRLEGRLLDWNWSSLAASERRSLARQSGELARALHDLEPPAEAAAALRFEWAALLAKQREAAPTDFADGGLGRHLIDGFPRFLAGAGDLAAAPHVLLHGDLSPINLVVEGVGAEITITGLLDFGDSRLGPFEHEFISPVMHFHAGEAEVLAAFYAGYGLDFSRRSAALETRLMARAALAYAELLENYRQRLPGAPGTSWRELARGFWVLTGERAPR